MKIPPIGSKGVALLGGVPLLKKVCHCWPTLRFPMLKSGPESHSLPAASQYRRKLSATYLTSCLQAFLRACWHDDNELIMGSIRVQSLTNPSQGSINSTTISKVISSLSVKKPTHNWASLSMFLYCSLSSPCYKLSQ